MIVRAIEMTTDQAEQMTIKLKYSIPAWMNQTIPQMLFRAYQLKYGSQYKDCLKFTCNNT